MTEMNEKLKTTKMTEKNEKNEKPNYLIFDYDKYPDITVEYESIDWESAFTDSIVTIASKMGDFRYVSKATYSAWSQEMAYDQFVMEECEEYNIPTKRITSYNRRNPKVEYNPWEWKYEKVKYAVVVSDPKTGEGVIHCGPTSKLAEMHRIRGKGESVENLILHGIGYQENFGCFEIGKDGKVHIPREFMVKYGYQKRGRYILILHPNFWYFWEDYSRSALLIRIPGIEKYLDSFENGDIIQITKNMDIKNLEFLGKDRLSKSIWYDEKNGRVEEDYD